MKSLNITDIQRFAGNVENLMASTVIMTTASAMSAWKRIGKI